MRAQVHGPAKLWRCERACPRGRQLRWEGAIAAKCCTKYDEHGCHAGMVLVGTDVGSLDCFWHLED
jgi:hypothetical protein